MFPRDPKKHSAAEKKPLQFARMVAGPDLDSDALLMAGLEFADLHCENVRRVAVKRQARSPQFPGYKGMLPSHSYTGKGFRIDVYMFQ